MVTRCNTYDKQPLTTYRTPAGILEFLISLVRMSWDSRNRCYQILILQASFFGIIDRGDTDTAETSKTHIEIRSNINIWTNIRVHTKYKIRVARFVMADDSQICSLGRQIRSPAAVLSLCNYAFAPFSAQRAMDYYRRTGPEVTTCNRIIVTIYIYIYILQLRRCVDVQHCTAGAVSSSHETSADPKHTALCAGPVCLLPSWPLSFHFLSTTTTTTNPPAPPNATYSLLSFSPRH